jgi:hypothetical protein
MFKAVNTESEYEMKLAEYERRRIQKCYLSAMKNVKNTNFFNLQVKYENNQAFYTSAKSNLLCTYIWETSTEQIIQEIEKLKILDFKFPFFELVRKSIKEHNYIRAKKLLNLARSKKWTNNDYFDLKREIKKNFRIKMGKKKFLKNV